MIVIACRACAASTKPVVLTALRAGWAPSFSGRVSWLCPECSHVAAPASPSDALAVLIRAVCPELAVEPLDGRPACLATASSTRHAANARTLLRGVGVFAGPCGPRLYCYLRS